MSRQMRERDERLRRRAFRRTAEKRGPLVTRWPEKEKARHQPLGLLFVLARLLEARFLTGFLALRIAFSSCTAVGSGPSSSSTDAFKWLSRRRAVSHAASNSLLIFAMLIGGILSGGVTESIGSHELERFKLAHVWRQRLLEQSLGLTDELQSVFMVVGLQMHKCRGELGVDDR